jgi:YYY domain-containing protein
MTVLLDWLAREGHILFSWWLWITLAGAAAFPLCLRLLRGLPDKGYTMARALGMLLATFIFWLLASFGFLDNSAGGIVLSWLMLLIIALVLYQRFADGNILAAWWRENRALVLAAELLFVMLFFGWALFRAHQNDLSGTEKPMELAFFSAAQRSSAFPPNDPWMSGYAISYYYMGYVMWSALSTLSGIGSTIGFNLTVASLFALTGLTTFGVAYNLVRSRLQVGASQLRGSPSRRGAVGAGLLATTLLILVGNFQMIFIEAPYQARAAPQHYLEFWGTQARSNFSDGAYQPDPDAILTLHSASWDYWWWFRASRVVTDYDLDGVPIGTQPIGEFPAFSFILGDNHPHVLALPFVVMVIGMMLNQTLERRWPAADQILLYSLAVGGLTLLNAWDGPIYLFGFVGAEALRRLMTSERGRLAVGDWLALVRFGASLALISLLAYLPYFVGFRSQAGGLLPNLLHLTQFRRFFIMFGPLITPIAAYLLVELWRGRLARRLNWRLALRASGLLLLLLAGVMMLLAVLIALSIPNMTVVGDVVAAPGETGELLGRLIQRRIDYGLSSIILLLGIVVVLARLFPAREQAEAGGEVAITWIKYAGATGFALLIIGMGLVLALFPEFLYLKDNFGVRINTVFKFYYQAWVLWSIAASYAVYSIMADGSLPQPHPLLRLGFAVVFALSAAAGLAYSIEAVYHRSAIETGRQRFVNTGLYAAPAEWDSPVRRVAESQWVEPGTILFSKASMIEATEADLIRARHEGIVQFDGDALIIAEALSLDGAQGLLNPDDQRAIECLSDLVGRADAVVAEAVGDPYRIEYGRVGTLAGIPIVLGWENHERQWRGNTYASIAGSRNADMKQLYTAVDMTVADDIIKRYGIDYILYGASERQKYGELGEDLFVDLMPVVCQSGPSSVYFAGIRKR